MVKPAGTGRPILVISARPAPLPPRRSRKVPSLSGLPAPKKCTHFFTVRLACRIWSCGILAAATVLERRPKTVGAPTLKTSSKTLDCLTPLFTANFREIRNGCELAEQFRQQGQTVVANGFILRHHHHAVEELVDDFSKAGTDFQGFLILPRALLRLHF